MRLFSTCLRALCLGAVLLTQGCHFYEMGPAAPRFRLARYVNASSMLSDITTRFAYNADQQISQVTFEKSPDYLALYAPDGQPVGYYTYDASQRLSSYELRYAAPAEKGRTSELTSFSYTPGAILSETYLLGPGSGRLLIKRTSATLVDGRVTTYSRETLEPSVGHQQYLYEAGSTRELIEYTYTDGNVTQTRTTRDYPKGQKTVDVTDYQYDKAPNPFQDLLLPYRGGGGATSRNNITQSSGTVTFYQDGVVTRVQPSTVYYSGTYVYNSQGLPVSANNGFYQYEYEAY